MTTESVSPRPHPHGGLLGIRAQHHTGIVTADFDGDIDFYRRTLGYELGFSVRGMADQFARMVGIPGVSCDLAQLYNPRTRTRIELIRTHAVPDDADPAAPVHVGVAHTAYLVDDIAAAAELIRDEGGRMLGEIVEFDEGPAAYFRTGGGTVIEIEQPHERTPEGGE